MFKDHIREILPIAISELGLRNVLDQFVVLVHSLEQAVRRQALNRKRAGDTGLPVVFVGLVIEVLVVGVGRDGSVDLLLPGDALFPPRQVGRVVSQAGGNIVQRITSTVLVVSASAPDVSVCARLRGIAPCPHLLVGPRVKSRGISHSSHVRFNAAFSSVRNGSSVSRIVSQITSISALLAMDFRVTCGDPLVHKSLSDVVVGRRFEGAYAGDTAALQLSITAVG